MFSLSWGPSNIRLYLKFLEQISSLALIEWLAWVPTWQTLAKVFKFRSCVQEQSVIENLAKFTVTSRLTFCRHVCIMVACDN